MFPRRFIDVAAPMLLLACTRSAVAADGASTSKLASQDWNRFTAAKYLDARQTWWMGWSKARRDHDTACVSCHTALPYAMSRPTLRRTLHESGLSAPEHEMLGYVTLRVNQWSAVEPFYSDEKVGPNKSIESRGTEAVLNAFILARYDAANGRRLSPVTETAFENMWGKQLGAGDYGGSWEWLNFHNAPWESNESHYYGAALAAVAVGIAPSHYRDRGDIQPAIAKLKKYLRTNYQSQPMTNRLTVLWASARLQGLLTRAQRQELFGDLKKMQHSDGGWSLTDFGEWTPRRDKTDFDKRSDGYATGLVVFALKQTGESPRRPEMKRGIAWLLANQDSQQGMWVAYSLNKQRDPATDVGRFMSDAATSYAVMALEAVHR